MEVFSQARRSARRLGPGVIAAVLLVVAVACTDPTNPPPTGHPPQPNQVQNFLDFYTQFRQANTDPNKRPWFCHALGSGEHQHHSDGVPQGDAGPVPAEYVGLQRGNLTWDQCRDLAVDLDGAKNYAMSFPTRRDAETRGGCRQTVQYLPGMGNHMACGGLGSTFVATRPNHLQYDGDGPNARIIGMSWLISAPYNDPPNGFPGDNDVWHRHNALCRPSLVSGRVLGNNLTDAACRALGGQNQVLGSATLGRTMWMVHAWIIPNWQFQTDVHAGMHPCLLTSGVAPVSDPCWAHAQHDHTLEPGEHDEHGMDH
jgi:hypothetical protein